MSNRPTRIAALVTFLVLLPLTVGCGDDDEEGDSTAAASSSAQQCPVDASICQFAVTVRNELNANNVQGTLSRVEESRIDCSRVPGATCPPDGKLVGVPVGKYAGQFSVLTKGQLEAYLRTAFKPPVRLVSSGCETDASCAQAFALAFASGSTSDPAVTILRFVKSGPEPRLIAAYTWTNEGGVVNGGDADLGEIATGRAARLTFHRYSPAP